MQAGWDSDCMDVRPVFRGLAEAGIAGKDIAEILCVAPSTVSKWRRGTLCPPDASLQFMTLVLADRIGSRERTLDAMVDAPLAWRLGRESEMSAMRQALRQQEAVNRTLPAAAIRDGALLYRAWLAKMSPMQPLRRSERAA